METPQNQIQHISTDALFKHPNKYLDGVLNTLLTHTESDTLPYDVVFMYNGLLLNPRDGYNVFMKLNDDGYAGMLKNPQRGDTEEYYITFKGAAFRKNGGYRWKYFREKVSTYFKLMHTIILGVAAVCAIWYYLWNMFIKREKPPINNYQQMTSVISDTTHVPSEKIYDKSIAIHPFPSRVKEPDTAERKIKEKSTNQERTKTK